jgi:hypothetical protein
MNATKLATPPTNVTTSPPTPTHPTNGVKILHAASERETVGVINAAAINAAANSNTDASNGMKIVNSINERAAI